MTTDSNCAGTEGDCQEALDQLELYLDGELPGADLGRIRDHLSACYPCADRATFEGQLRALVKDHCAEASPPELREAILRRLDGMSTQGA
ncbi:MAG TPA: mycothiol system anti-sigma-R factor [Nitriliruptoraceae bacterium]|nr:mycothiol system anti-sigma-R factor [Nitriliruptoraceae bacterium]